MHCPCGREKIVANGLCASCYTLKRQDAEYFEGCAKRYLNATATVAGSAMLLADASAR